MISWNININVSILETPEAERELKKVKKLEQEKWYLIKIIINILNYNKYTSFLGQTEDLNNRNILYSGAVEGRAGPHRARPPHSRPVRSEVVGGVAGGDGHREPGVHRGPGGYGAGVQPVLQRVLGHH